jgi:hypothetical protein
MTHLTRLHHLHPRCWRGTLLFLALLLAAVTGGLGSHNALAANAASATASVNFEPTVPFMLDGVRYAPAEIQRFDHQPLHFVLDHQAQAEGVLHAFKTREDAGRYMASQANTSTAMVQPGRATQSATSCLPYHARIYNWTNYNQDWLDLSADLHDLRQVHRGWWPWDNWNDVISSIRVGCQTSVTLYVNTDHTGGSFAIPQNTSLQYLDWIDNLTSSIAYREWDPVCQVLSTTPPQYFCEVYDDYGNCLGGCQ